MRLYYKKCLIADQFGKVRVMKNGERKTKGCKSASSGHSKRLKDKKLSFLIIKVSIDIFLYFYYY